MDAGGYSVSYARSPPKNASQQSSLAPSAPTSAHGSSAGTDERASADSKMFAAFTDATKMPVGAMRTVKVPNSGELLFFGYLVPLSANLTRHFYNFAAGSPEVSAIQLAH